MIFLGLLILFRSKNSSGTNIYKNVPNFLFFGYNNVSDFLEFSSETKFSFSTILILQKLAYSLIY